MKICSPPRRVLITYVALYLILAAVAARAAIELDEPSEMKAMAGMLALYVVLMAAEPWLLSRSLTFLHGLNALQTGIGLVLLLFVHEFDFFSLLFIPPCVLSLLNFPRKIAFVWIGAICLLMEAALFEHFPLSESAGLLIAYPATIFLFSGSAYLAMQAEEAQAELQEANQKLRAYAVQVQELAAAAERNRLARELHDSATQTIFSLMLSVQATRILLKRDPERAARELEHIQGLAQNALAEMRALIQHLRPRSIAEEGLVAALRRLAAERKASDGLVVDVQVSGERRLPVNTEEELYRIAQEALNNIVKHAQTDYAQITLRLEDVDRVGMCIEDAGLGFDPSKVRALPGHLGLTSMAERIQALGGRLVVDSRPGKGTRVQVDLALAQEMEHAG